MYGPIWTKGVGIGNGEVMELVNAHMYRYASSTKHMTAAGKLDENLMHLLYPLRVSHTLLHRIDCNTY
jgi:hypothetical protein